MSTSARTASPLSPVTCRIRRRPTSSWPTRLRGQGHGLARGRVHHGCTSITDAQADTTDFGHKADQANVESDDASRRYGHSQRRRPARQGRSVAGALDLHSRADQADREQRRSTTTPTTCNSTTAFAISLTVEREIVAALPPGTTYDFHINSAVAAEVNRSLEPESISLGVFGLIAGLAALIIAGGVIARGLQRESEDIEVLRALGGSPAMSAERQPARTTRRPSWSDRRSRWVVAYALSPLVAHRSGARGLSRRRLRLRRTRARLRRPPACSFFSARSVRSHAATISATGESQYERLSAPLGSRAGRLASDLGLPVTAVVGIRFALEPPVDRDAAPVRSALVGAVLAVTIVVATLTFGSSLNTLVIPSVALRMELELRAHVQRQRHSAAGRASARSRSVRRCVFGRQLRQRADRRRDGARSS